MKGNTEEDDLCFHSFPFLFHPSHFTKESYQNARICHCISNLCVYVVHGSLGCIQAPHDLSPANFFCLIPQHSLPCTSHSATPCRIPVSPGFHASTCNTVGWTIPTPQPYRQFLLVFQDSTRAPLPQEIFSCLPHFLSSHFYDLSKFNSSFIKSASIY